MKKYRKFQDKMEEYSSKLYYSKSCSKEKSRMFPQNNTEKPSHMQKRDKHIVLFPVLQPDLDVFLSMSLSCPHSNEILIKYCPCLSIFLMFYYGSISFDAKSISFNDAVLMDPASYNTENLLNDPSPSKRMHWRGDCPQPIH